MNGFDYLPEQNSEEKNASGSREELSLDTSAWKVMEVMGVHLTSFIQATYLHHFDSAEVITRSDFPNSAAITSITLHDPVRQGVSYDNSN